MLRDEKILITGPAGQIAWPLCRYLATDNEVWGVARFSQPGSREAVEKLGVTTRVVDLGDEVFVVEAPGTWRGVVVDATKRLALTGPCRVGWREGMRRTFEARYPGGVTAATKPATGAAHAMGETEPA